MVTVRALSSVEMARHRKSLEDYMRLPQEEKDRLRFEAERELQSFLLTCPPSYEDVPYRQETNEEILKRDPNVFEKDGILYTRDGHGIRRGYFDWNYDG